MQSKDEMNICTIWIVDLENNTSCVTFSVRIGQLFEQNWAGLSKLSQMQYFDVFEAKSMPNRNFHGSSQVHSVRLE